MRLYSQGHGRPKHRHGARGLDPRTLCGVQQPWLRRPHGRTGELHDGSEELAIIEKAGILGRVCFPTDEKGQYEVLRVHAKGRFSVTMKEPELKTSLAKRVMDLGVKVINRTMAIALLKNGDRVTGAIGMNVRTGEIAAESATEYSARTKALELDMDQVTSFLNARDARFDQGGNQVLIEEFEYEVRRMINDYIFPPKNDYKLNSAIWWMNRFRKELVELVRIRDVHDLFRFYEIENIIQCATVSAVASRERKESRWGLWHHRTDDPGRDDKEWLKHIVLTQGEAPEDVKVSYNNIIKFQLEEK